MSVIFKVKGISHYREACATLEEMDGPKTVKLTRPESKKYRNAIAVYVNGQQIGFVPPDIKKEVQKRMRMKVHEPVLHTLKLFAGGDNPHGMYYAKIEI